MYDNGAVGLMTVGTLDGMAPLVFKADSGPLHEISYSLNDYMARLFGTPIACSSKAGSKIVSFQNMDLSKVVLKSVYTGPETEVANHLKNSKNTAVQGEAAMAIQVSNLRITEGHK